MELTEREKETLGFYVLVSESGYYSKSEQIEVRKEINEDLNDLLDEDKISIEEFNTMHEELDKLDKLQ